MSEKSNILVSETFDHSLLGEGFLASLIHARAALMDAENVTLWSWGRRHCRAAVPELIQ